jgi:hypothetical protein
MTHEPVANDDYSNAVGELKGPGINNLSEGDMDILTQEIEEKLFKEALGNKDSRLWATNQIARKENEDQDRTRRDRKERHTQGKGRRADPTDWLEQI